MHSHAIVPRKWILVEKAVPIWSSRFHSLQWGRRAQRTSFRKAEVDDGDEAEARTGDETEAEAEAETEQELSTDHSPHRPKT